MRFSEYMNEWLYAKDGYYSHFRDIGKDGDFYTAVSTSKFFGASIANFLFKEIKRGAIPRSLALVEIGAHKGYLLADMIEWLYSCDASLIETMEFITIERFEPIKEAQREYFFNRFGDDIELKQFSSIKELNSAYAFFISNEIFDAFPCELYLNEKIAEVNNNSISWVDADSKILEFAKRHNLTKGEIAIGYEEFAKEVVSSVESFDFISFDYGERYVRNDFSIRVYKEHKTYPLFDDEIELSKLFKDSDITYDVNFNHLIDAFEGAGANLKAYETQARALVRFGIIDILEQYSKVATYSDYLRQADRIKTLIAPTMMGDRFKMVHFTKRGKDE